MMPNYPFVLSFLVKRRARQDGEYVKQKRKMEIIKRRVVKDFSGGSQWPTIRLVTVLPCSALIHFFKAMQSLCSSLRFYATHCLCTSERCLQCLCFSTPCHSWANQRYSLPLHFSAISASLCLCSSNQALPSHTLLCLCSLRSALLRLRWARLSSHRLCQSWLCISGPLPCFFLPHLAFAVLRFAFASQRPSKQCHCSS